MIFTSCILNGPVSGAYCRDNHPLRSLKRKRSNSSEDQVENEQSDDSEELTDGSSDDSEELTDGSSDD